MPACAERGRDILETVLWLPHTPIFHRSPDRDPTRSAGGGHAAAARAASAVIIWLRRRSYGHDEVHAILLGSRDTASPWAATETTIKANNGGPGARGFVGTTNPMGWRCAFSGEPSAATLGVQGGQCAEPGFEAAAHLEELLLQAQEAAADRREVPRLLAAVAALGALEGAAAFNTSAWHGRRVLLRLPAASMAILRHRLSLSLGLEPAREVPRRRPLPLKHGRRGAQLSIRLEILVHRVALLHVAPA